MYTCLLSPSPTNPTASTTQNACTTQKSERGIMVYAVLKLESHPVWHVGGPGSLSYILLVTLLHNFDTVTVHKRKVGIELKSRLVAIAESTHCDVLLLSWGDGRGLSVLSRNLKKCPQDNLAEGPMERIGYSFFCICCSL